MSVISKTIATNEVRTYYVSRLAGPRIGRVRVLKGEGLSMTEHQARGLLASGELVRDEALVDDPWGEAAAAKVRADAEAQQAADKAAEDARKAADDLAHRDDAPEVAHGGDPNEGTHGDDPREAVTLDHHV